MLPDSSDSSQLLAPEVCKHGRCNLLSAVLSIFLKKISNVLKKSNEFPVHPRENMIRLILDKRLSGEVTPPQEKTAPMKLASPKLNPNEVSP